MKLHLNKNNIIFLALSVLLIITSIIIVIQSRYSLCVQYDKSVNFILGYIDRSNRMPEKHRYYAFMFYAVPTDARYGQQFVKKVGCLEGEHLQNRGRDFYCNGEYIGTAKEKDKQGNPAPLFTFNGIIMKGKFFAIGETKDSYDSKYWGFVNNQWIIGSVTKIF